MRVARENKKVDCYIGDIILFDEVPCMVIDMGLESDFYGILALEGVDVGCIIEEFEKLSDIDEDERTTGMLINRKEVVIHKEGEKCQY